MNDYVGAIEDLEAAMKSVNEVNVNAREELERDISRLRSCMQQVKK